MRKPTTQQLCTLPDALSFGDPHKPVSSRSVWSDAVWRLDFDYFGAPSFGASVYWAADAAPEVTELLRRATWSILAAPAGTPISTATLARMSSAIGILARFMTNGEYLDLRELDETAMSFLVENLRETARSIDADAYEDLDPDEGEADDDGAIEGEAADWTIPTGGALSHSIVLTLFQFVALVHRQRHVLRRIGVPTADEDPLGGLSPRSWATRVRAPSARLSQPIPDEIAVPMMIATDRLLGTPADEVVAMQHDYLEARGCALGDEVSTPQRKRGADAVTGRPFGTIVGEAQPWHPALPLLRTDGSCEAVPRSIRDLVVTIRDVAIITLLQLTGMRVGEIVALRATEDPRTGLPLCVKRMRSPSGERDLFYAESHVNKGRDAPELELWLLGSVAAGSNSVPTTVRAIRVLDRLLAPWRELATDPRSRVALIVCLRTGGIPETPKGVLPPSTVNVTQSIKRTYGRLVDWDALPERAAGGTSLSRFKATRGSCIHGSQWRKTFAVNVVRTDSRLLNALRRHFKHMHLATTEGSYVGNSIEILEDIDEAQLQMTMRFLRDRTRTGAPTVGRTGSIIKRNLNRIARIEEHGHPQLGADMSEVLRATDTGLWQSDHGLCAISLSPEHGACHRLAGDASYLNDRPHPGFQRPEVCAGCRCFVADASHLPYWRNRFIENNRAKREQRRSGEPAASRVFETKARRAWPIARALRNASRSSRTPRNTR